MQRTSLALAAVAAIASLSRADDYATLDPLNLARQESAAAVLRGSVYVVGGLTASGAATPTVERYDHALNQWAFVAPLPIGLDHLGVAAAADRLYAIGGYTGNFVPRREVYRYDPDANSWTRIADLPAPRGALWAVAVGERIYTFGGVAPGAGASRTTFIFDTTTGMWSQGADMPTAREHLTAAPAGTDVYVIGGRAGGVPSAANERYDTLTNTWLPRAPMPTARSAMATGEFPAGGVGGRIFAIGGEIPQLFSLNQVYDPATNTWSGAAPIPVARHGFAAVALECGLVLPGGGTVQGLQPSTRVDLYRPNPTADFNDDAHVDSQDFFDFLAAFFAGDPRADFNGDDAVNSQDFFDFLAVFFAGC